MPDNIQETIGDKQEQERLAIEKYVNNLRVAIPGIIRTFDDEKQTVTVQPAMKEQIKGVWHTLPLLLDVPLQFPRAGGYCLTFPVKPGDECLVVFNDMCIDSWWQSGDVQTQLEKRRHDLSDAVAVIGITSVPEAVEDYSTDSVQLRNEDKDIYFEITDDKRMYIKCEDSYMEIDDGRVESVIRNKDTAVDAYHLLIDAKENFVTLDVKNIEDSENPKDTINLRIDGNEPNINIKTTNVDTMQKTTDFTLNGKDSKIDLTMNNPEKDEQTISIVKNGKNGQIDIETKGDSGNININAHGDSGEINIDTHGNVNLSSAKNVDITAMQVNITADVNITGNLTLVNENVVLNTHKHGGVETGGGVTNIPQN